MMIAEASGERKACAVDTAECRVQSTEYRVRSTGYRAQNRDCRTMLQVRATRSRVLGAPYSVLRTRYSVLGTVYSILLRHAIRRRRASEELWPLFSRHAFVNLPNLIGPLFVFANVFHARSRHDHGADEADGHLPYLRAFLKQLGEFCTRQIRAI